MSRCSHHDVRPQTGYGLIELLLMVAIPLALFALAFEARHALGMGPVFLHPGTAESAQQMVRDSVSGVDKVGGPTITGDRMVTLPVTIAGKGCSVQLHAPLGRENDYGWKIKQVDCAAPPVG